MARKKPKARPNDDELPKKKKKRPVVDDGSDISLDEPEREKPISPVGSRNDAFTGLAILSFFVLVLTAVLFYMDYEELNASPVQQVSQATITVPALGAVTKGAPSR